MLFILPCWLQAWSTPIREYHQMTAAQILLQKFQILLEIFPKNCK